MLEGRRRERRGGASEDDCPEYAETDPSGRYGRFDEMLGKGAMKTVYRAFDEVNGVEVAWNQAKICDVMRSPEALQRLYSEVSLLSTLDHGSIIRFHTSWVDAGKRTFNFITEMFTSGTLREYRQKHRRVDIRAVKNWSRQILHGLVYLHGHDPPVIHRDLKCDNIFVNGHLGQVKIGDLGLAAILRGSQAAHSVIGTPEFMAPELYDEEYNELVDIYAFGMCVLEMLTGEYPYSECTNPAQIYRKVTSGKLPEVFYRVQDPEARRFIGRCLEHDASKRSSAKELLLDSFLSSEGSDTPANRRASTPPAAGPDRRRAPELGGAGQSKRAGTDHMTITGKMNPEDDAIILKVQIRDKNGRVQNVYFPFDVVSDTPFDVASEMVKELEITDRDPKHIADVIAQEVAALVPDWREAEDRNHHTYDYGVEDERHPFCELSSPTSTQGSLFGCLPSCNARYHRCEEELDDDDDPSSPSSTYSGSQYSDMNCCSSFEPEFEPPEGPVAVGGREPPSAAAAATGHRATRFCPEENSRLEQSLVEKLRKQFKLLPGPSGRGSRATADGRRLQRNRSLVDIRSQLLHKALVEEVNKRLFKTVGSVENIGFQAPEGISGRQSTGRGCTKNAGLTWGR